jgi:hypothetical protein
MLRVFLTIVLPLLFPTLLYLLWLGVLRFQHQEPATARATLPWVWLAGAGLVLLAVALFAVTVHFGASQEGVYVPPRWQDGRILPGHIEPPR